MEPKKSKLRQFQEGAETAVNDPSLDPDILIKEKFKQLRQMIGQPVPSSEIYQDQGEMRKRSLDGLSSQPFDMTQDDMDRAKAVQQQLLKSKYPQTSPSTRELPGDIKALLDQQQYLEQLQDFDRAEPEDVQKLQRIKEMLRQK